MEFGPAIRILLRYGVGYVVGSETGEAMAMDAELVNMLAIGVAVLVESVYAYAKKRGWAT